MPKRFVSEAINPVAGAGDTERISIVEPGLPSEFVWRGGNITVTGMLRASCETGRSRRGSPELSTAAHLWAAEGDPDWASLPGTPVAELPWEAERLMRGEIPRMKAAPGPGSEVTDCRRLLLPLLSGEAFFGGIGVVAPPGSPLRAPEDTLILQTAAEILMRCIENHRITETLETHRRDLKAAVERKAFSLQRANLRLADEADWHQATMAALKERDAVLSAHNQTLLELGNALATLVSRPAPDPEGTDSCALERIDRLVGTLGAAGWGASGGACEADRISQDKEQLRLPLPDPHGVHGGQAHEGKGSREIAAALGLSRRTVEVHRCHIRKKLQLDKVKVNLRAFLETME